MGEDMSACFYVSPPEAAIGERELWFMVFPPFHFHKPCTAWRGCLEFGTILHMQSRMHGLDFGKGHSDVCPIHSFIYISPQARKHTLFTFNNFKTPVRYFLFVWIFVTPRDKMVPLISEQILSCTCVCFVFLFKRSITSLTVKLWHGNTTYRMLSRQLDFILSGTGSAASGVTGIENDIREEVSLVVDGGLRLLLGRKHQYWCNCVTTRDGYQESVPAENG